MFSIQPSRLTNAELSHYAQGFLDRGDALPLSWQVELLRRFNKILDDGK